LREAVFTQRLQAAIFEESRGIDPTIQSPDQVRVGAGAEARLIAKWYQEEFMGQPKEPEKPVVAQNTQAEQKKHFFLIRWLYRDEEQKAPSKAKPALARQAPDQSKTPPPNLPPLAEMRAKILESMPVGQAALTTLAQQRADNVQKYILEHGELSEDRVSVEPLSEPKPATRALLELR
jgi:hypothetical protein